MPLVGANDYGYGISSPTDSRITFADSFLSEPAPDSSRDLDGSLFRRVVSSG